MTKTRLRLSVLTISLACFSQNILFAYSTENKFWSDRRQATTDRQQGNIPANFAGLSAASPLDSLRQMPAVATAIPTLSKNISKHLPASFIKENTAILTALSPTNGTVRRILLPSTSSGKTIIHIQDVHQNEDAQKNIGRTVEDFLISKNVGLIALEGSSKPIVLKPYREMTNRKTVRKVANWLLRENKISGPVYAGMTAPSQVTLPPILGIDDDFHYRANVNAYRQSAPHQTNFRKTLTTQRTALELEKPKVYSKALQDFDQKVQPWHSGTGTFGNYIQALTTCTTGPVDPSIKAFSDTLSMEKSLDFTRVQSERSALVETLAARLTPTELQSIAARAAAHKLGQIGYGQFYSELSDLCRTKKVLLSKYPAVDAYIRYVLKADETDVERINTESMKLEKTIYARLANTPDARRLADTDRHLFLAGKLVDFSLTPEEWADYQVLSTEKRNTPPLNLTSFENFYKEAHARDEAMTQNLLKEMNTRNVTTALLVTGGFHASGMDERLQKAGITTIAFVPKIEKIDTANGSAYLSVFSQEKSPLEKLFAGEKLFLAAHPMSPATAQTVAVVTTALNVLGGVTTPEAANTHLESFMAAQTPPIEYTHLDPPAVTAEVTEIRQRVKALIDQVTSDLDSMSIQEKLGFAESESAELQSISNRLLALQETYQGFIIPSELDIQTIIDDVQLLREILAREMGSALRPQLPSPPSNLLDAVLKIDIQSPTRITASVTTRGASDGVVVTIEDGPTDIQVTQSPFRVAWSERVVFFYHPINFLRAHFSLPTWSTMGQKAIGSLVYVGTYLLSLYIGYEVSSLIWGWAVPPSLLTDLAMTGTTIAFAGEITTPFHALYLTFARGRNTVLERANSSFRWPLLTLPTDLTEYFRRENPFEPSAMSVLPRTNGQLNPMESRRAFLTDLIEKVAQGSLTETPDDLEPRLAQILNDLLKDDGSLAIENIFRDGNTLRNILSALRHDQVLYERVRNSLRDQSLEDREPQILANLLALGSRGVNAVLEEQVNLRLAEAKREKKTAVFEVALDLTQKATNTIDSLSFIANSLSQRPAGDGSEKPVVLLTFGTNGKEALSLNEIKELVTELGMADHASIKYQETEEIIRDQKANLVVLEVVLDTALQDAKISSDNILLTLILPRGCNIDPASASMLEPNSPLRSAVVLLLSFLGQVVVVDMESAQKIAALLKQMA